MTYDDLARYMDEALGVGNEAVSGTIKDVAKRVAHGTGMIAKAVELVPDDEAPKRPQINLPPPPQTPTALPQSYLPQAPDVQFEPVLTQLKRLRA
jgi:hypothetical protein